jgi:hypothetical protein
MEVEKMAEHIEQMVQDHEKRIGQLEKNYDEVKRDIAQIQNGQLRIETTLLQESRDQKALLNKIITQKFSIDKINTTEKWKFLGALVGSGGILYVIIELIKGVLQ